MIVKVVVGGSNNNVVTHTRSRALSRGGRSRTNFRGGCNSRCETSVMKGGNFTVTSTTIDSDTFISTFKRHQ